MDKQQKCVLNIQYHALKKQLNVFTKSFVMCIITSYLKMFAINNSDNEPFFSYLYKQLAHYYFSLIIHDIDLYHIT